MKNIVTNQLKRMLRKERKMASQLSNHEDGIHEYSMKTMFSRLLTFDTTDGATQLFSLMI